MNRRSSAAASAVLLAAVLAVPAAQAQLNTASAVRGKVLDGQGQPIPGVAVELEFKGESRVKILKKTVTDKKGGYIYSGLLPGPWVFHFTKTGFKPTQIQTEISLGGLSDIASVTMEPGGDSGVAGAIGAAAAGAPSAPAAPPGAGTDRAKELADKYTKALAAMKTGAPAEAETLLKEVVAVVPAFAPAHQALAAIYVGRGDMAAAEASYRKVVELDPQSPVSYLALSNFLATQGRNEEALTLLKEAAPKFPQDALVQFALGAAAFNLGRNDEAKAAFLKTIEIDPTTPEPHFYLGSLAISGGDVPTAITHLEKYVALAPATAANVGPAKALIETLKKKK